MSAFDEADPIVTNARITCLDDGRGEATGPPMFSWF